MKPWSDLSLAEKVAVVREMAAMKLSFSQIAAELNTTKGAVSGVHRRNILAQKRDTIVAKMLEGFPSAVPLLAARPHHCRWVVVPAESGLPTMVCGAHAADPDHPWCEQHIKRVFTPYQPRGVDHRWN